MLIFIDPEFKMLLFVGFIKISQFAGHSYVLPIHIHTYTYFTTTHTICMSIVLYMYISTA